MSQYSNERLNTSMWICVSYTWEGSGRGWERENCNQNMLNEKIYFQCKKEREKMADHLGWDNLSGGSRLKKSYSQLFLSTHTHTHMHTHLFHPFRTKKIIKNVAIIVGMGNSYWGHLNYNFCWVYQSTEIRRLCNSSGSGMDRKV